MATNIDELTQANAMLREANAILTQDYATLRQEHAALRQERTATPEKRAGNAWGCLGSIAFWLVVLTMAALLVFAIVPGMLVSYGYVSEETMARWLKMGAATVTTDGKQGGTGGDKNQNNGGGGQNGQGNTGSFDGSAPRSTLPDCSNVTDTTTACVQTSEAVPAPLATGTPEPRWVTETCLTPPGERPCWLPADQAWEPPATIPETPIVLLPEPTSVPMVFVDSACAAWHPPLPYPEECDE